MQEQTVARDLERPPAGQHVETDRGDALRRQTLGDDAQQRVAQRLGDPAEHAVANDEIERAVLGADLIQTARAKLDVGKLEPRDTRLPLRDLHRRKVDADKLGVWPGGRERNDVAARRASNLKDARSRNGRSRQPEPQRRRRHSRGLLPDEGKQLVRRRIIACPGAGKRLAD